MTDIASGEDDIDGAFPGTRLSHHLSVVTEGEIQLAISLLMSVRDRGGRLEGLQIRQRGDAMEHQISISDLRSSEVRLISDDLSALPGVRHAQVEHRLIRVGEFASRN